MVDGVLKPGGSQPGLQQEYVADFVEEQGRDVHFKEPAFHLFKEGPRLFEELFVAGLEPLDEDRGINDDLRGRAGLRCNSE